MMSSKYRITTYHSIFLLCILFFLTSFTLAQDDEITAGNPIVRFPEHLRKQPALPFIAPHGSFRTPSFGDVFDANVNNQLFVILQTFDKNSLGPIPEAYDSKLRTELMALRNAYGIDHAAVLVGKITLEHINHGTDTPGLKSEFRKYDLQAADARNFHEECYSRELRRVDGNMTDFRFMNLVKYQVGMSTTTFSPKALPNRKLLWIGLTAKSTDDLADIPTRYIHSVGHECYHFQEATCYTFVQWLVKDLGLGWLQMEGGHWSFVEDEITAEGGEETQDQEDKE
ncbi:hypothetical protein BJ508DRAFT_410893 [Ascobolus immersus RN42]|uniref:Uncharacterized protein n=1 Tax=Ascobolus immersus RN42 TaxID=1160509 RepID=A0A3N4ILV7_ASCIM|nr:hypothetical protein BJ508DRAFT_410893 [Ascobolus immersus RN42]